MPKFLFSNLASAQLAADITATDDTVTVVAGQGALFPTPAEGERFALVLRKGSGDVEILHCTARTADTFTVLRGQENTTPLAWSLGDWISNRTTAQALNAWASADVGALAIDPMHIFADATARDDYFIENPDEMTKGIFIAVGGNFQMRTTDSWRDMTAVMRGAQGPIGDVTQDMLDQVDLARRWAEEAENVDVASGFSAKHWSAKSEAFAAAALTATTLQWNSGTTYNFPDTVIGSDGHLYRCMGTAVLNEDPTTT